MPSAQPAASDQAIGTGDGTRKLFQLVKVGWSIAKPVAGTVKVAVAGVATPFSVEKATGLVTLAAAPAAGASVTAEFEFDTPVRFDLDRLDGTLEGFAAARVTASAPVEIRV